MIDMTKGFTLTREFDATPAELWQAWTDPDEVAVWWHPAGMHTPRETVSMDLRVGGDYAFTMVNDANGEEYRTAGVFRELVENERLAFTWGRPGDEDAPLIIVTFEGLGELTRLTLELRGLDGMSGDGDIYDGWESALDELARHLGPAEVAG
jgi:uncharacterized protein YndB with AHSA1/START domain